MAEALPQQIFQQNHYLKLIARSKSLPQPEFRENEPNLTDGLYLHIIITSTRGDGEAEQKIREEFLAMDADK